MSPLLVVILFSIAGLAFAKPGPVQHDVQSSRQFFQAGKVIGTDQVRSLSTSEEAAVVQEMDLSALYCSGSNLKKEAVAAFCTEGNYLSFSGYDCMGKCKCDKKGDISCNTPSDCPQKDVAKYCVANDLFKCTCLSNESTTERFKKDVSVVKESSEQMNEDVDADDLTTNNHDPTSKDVTDHGQDDGVPVVIPCWWWPVSPCLPSTKHTSTVTAREALATIITKVSK